MSLRPGLCAALRVARRLPEVARLGSAPLTPPRWANIVPDTASHARGAACTSEQQAPITVLNVCGDVGVASCQEEMADLIGLLQRALVPAADASSVPASTSGQ